jgi:hypothetical protein
LGAVIITGTLEGIPVDIELVPETEEATVIVGLSHAVVPGIVVVGKTEAGRSVDNDCVVLGTDVPGTDVAGTDVAGADVVEGKVSDGVVGTVTLVPFVPLVGDCVMLVPLTGVVGLVGEMVGVMMVEVPPVPVTIVEFAVVEPPGVTDGVKLTPEGAVEEPDVVVGGGRIMEVLPVVGNVVTVLPPVPVGEVIVLLPVSVGEMIVVPFSLPED